MTRFVLVLVIGALVTGCGGPTGMLHDRYYSAGTSLGDLTVDPGKPGPWH